MAKASNEKLGDILEKIRSDEQYSIDQVKSNEERDNVKKIREDLQKEMVELKFVATQLTDAMSRCFKENLLNESNAISGFNNAATATCSSSGSSQPLLLNHSNLAGSQLIGKA